MKPCARLLIAGLCLLASSSLFAQKSTARATIFQQYPSSIPCKISLLQQLFAAGKGSAISLLLPGNLELKGNVTHVINGNNKMQTVALQLPAFHNIHFSVTRRLDEKGNVIYAGHLFSSDYADGYELKRNTDGTYRLDKVEMEKMLPTCNQ